MMYVSLLRIMPVRPSGAVAVQPQRDGAPREEHGEKHEPRFVEGIAPVENARGRNGKGQGGPARGLASEPTTEQEKDRHAEQAGDDDRQAQRPEIAPEQFLREKDGVKMPRPVEIGRIVVEETGIAQAVGEPSVDTLVEVRGLEVEQDETQSGGQHLDGDEVPRQRAHFGRHVHGERTT
jgi:hypothetical protein